MPALLTLPFQVPLSTLGGILPGARLFFFQTGTSTPQNVYQNIGLTVAHASPVVADGAGVFPKIYLDPTLPNYRIRLENSAGVVQPGYPVDDVPSNQNAAQTFRLISGSPQLLFEESDAGAGNKKWALSVNSQALSIDVLSDDESTRTKLFNLTRLGTAVGEYTLLPAGLGSIQVLPQGAGEMNVLSYGSGSASGLLKYKDREVSTIVSGAFTGTFTGFTTPVQLQCEYHRIGSPRAASTVILTIPAFTSTSNATTLTLTGLPTVIAAATGLLQPIFVTNNGSDVAGNARIVVGAAQVVTFGVGAAAGGFTGSGTKGLPGEYIQLIYKTTTP